jgi:Flp pilus assembly protein CpaB
LRTEPRSLDQGPAPTAPAVPRASRPRRPPRLTAGSVVPFALALLAAVLTYAALQDRSATTEVAVAGRAIPLGWPVGPQDIRAVTMRAADRDVASGLVSPGRLGRGWVAAVPIPAGEPITQSELRPASAAPALGEMSIPVPVDQAAGGRLAPGDEVDVIASTAGGAYYVAQGLRVISVAPASATGGVLASGSSSFYVVVAVGKQEALRVAAAIGSQGAGAAGAAVQVVRSDGEKPVAPRAYSLPSANAGAQG